MQSSHALLEFAAKYPSDFHRWHKESNYLHQKVVADEYELEQLALKAEQKGIRVVRFYEPDIGNELTAIALESSKESNKLTAKLPFLFEEQKQLQKVA